MPCNEATEHGGQLSPESPEKVSKRIDSQVSDVIDEDMIELTITQGS